MLTRAQLFRAFALLLSVAAIYLAAIRFLIVSRARRASGEQPSQRFLFWRKIIYSLAILGLVCAAYGRWIEPRWLATTHVSLTTHSLPAGATLRIVHLSDLHSEASPLLEGPLPARVAAEHPDLIVFTGDLANTPEGVKTAERLLQQLAKVAPVYAVRGNWDFHAWNDTDMYRRSGTTLIDATSAQVTIRGATVRITGVGADRSDYSLRVLADLPQDGFVIHLEHYPDEIERIAPQGRANLYLAGHTHGGQIALPFYGALVTLSVFDKKYESGLHRVGNTYLYVSRGIGTEGGPAPKIRFCARPELVVIDVVGAQ